MKQGSIPSLTDFLTTNGWVVINDNLMILDEKDLVVKIEDDKLIYSIRKNEESEIPLEIAIHHYQHLIPDYSKYEKVIKLINTLKRRNLEVCYGYSNFRWNGNDEYWDWAGFYLVSIRTDESFITMEDDGFINIYTKWNHGLYDEDEIIMGVMIELGLIINPDFHYDRLRNRFDLSEFNKQKIVKANKDYFSSF